MIERVPVVPFTPTDRVESYAELEALVTVAGWTKEDLGPSSDPAVNVYGFKLGDTSAKPVVLIQAQIHGGHEWNTSHWAAAFMDLLASPPAGRLAPIVTRLRAEFAFYVIPCLNPYGYVNDTYCNANTVNLNRNYDLNWAALDDSDDPCANGKGSAPESEPETQYSAGKIRDLKPLLFIDCHTEGGGTGITIAPPNKYRLLMSDVLDSVALTTGADKQLLTGSTNPLSRAYASSLASRQGVTTIGCTLETGSLETTEDQGTLGMTSLLAMCLAAERYHRTRALRS